MLSGERPRRNTKLTGSVLVEVELWVISKVPASNSERPQNASELTVRNRGSALPMCRDAPEYKGWPSFHTHDDDVTVADADAGQLPRFIIRKV